MKKLFFFIFISFFFVKLYAQTGTYLYDFRFYKQIDSNLYSPKSRVHTSIKPFQLDDSILLAAFDSIVDPSIDISRDRSWLMRKLLYEHLIEIREKDFNVNIDFLPDFQIGRDFLQNKTTWLNTRGFQIQGNIGKKFSFYTSAYENQGVFPGYLTQFINENQIIPGIVNDKTASNQPPADKKDWAWASAILNYTPNKYFSFTLGQDKNFIGDGYRSMLLSDVSANYPFFKIVTTLGNVKYVNIWAQFNEIPVPRPEFDINFKRKWGAFHYLDWNVNNRLSVGFFESIIWADNDPIYGTKRGFDVSYLNPLIFYRTIEGSNGSPDNALIGFNGKYKLAGNFTFYGQFILDEFTAGEFFSNKGYWGNKYGLQTGFRVTDAFKIRNLGFLAEFNTAKPYTYSSAYSISNYGNYRQSLAHPFGANFRELLSVWNYSFKRWGFYLQGNYANYGLDPSELNNYGKDIFKSYDTREAGYGNSTGQGLKTNFFYLDSRFSLLLNPKSNLRLELGGVYRKETNSLTSDRTTWVTFGLRSSFRNIYQDF